MERGGREVVFRVPMNRSFSLFFLARRYRVITLFFYAEQRASRARDGREAILKRTRVVAQAPTSTLVSLRITLLQAPGM